MIFSLVFLIRRDLKVKPDRKNAVIGGALSGFLAGILGTGGAVRGAVMTTYNLSKERFIATSAVIDLAVDFSRTVVYANNGYIHKHDLYLVPFLIVVSIVGTYIGKRILQRITQQQFRNFVLLLLLLIGLITLVYHIPGAMDWIGSRV